ncbi:MAG: IS30 family transposase [bacterium]
MHTHNTRDMRVSLGALLRAGVKKAGIARQLGVHRSTISRELKRNAKKNGRYHATHADVRAKARRMKSKEAGRLLANNQQLADLVEALLDPLVSPEVIAHLLDISHETIYAWLYRTRPDLLARLPQRGRKRRRYGSKRTQKQGWTKNVRSIEERTEPGWEGDTVKGAGRERILTHVHQSLYLVADLIPNGTADVVHAVLKSHQKVTGTITYDRGSEFALWQFIERDTDATVYFAHAHHPWERGKNENTNGRLRRPFPKRLNLGTISKDDLADVVDLMNHTPRKSLSWQTSCVRFGKACCVSD